MSTEKRVSVRIVPVGGDKVRAEFEQIGAAGEQAMTQVGRSSGQATAQLQNAAFQVGDFFVQVGAGTDVMRAAAMQLPQLLGGFGMFGAVAGAAASVAYVLTQSLFKTSEEAKSVEDTIKDLTSATKAYDQAAEQARTPIEELTKRYGALADEVQRAYEAQRVMRAEEARRALTQAASANPFALGLDQSSIDAARADRQLAAQLAEAQALASTGSAEALARVAQIASERMASSTAEASRATGQIENLSREFGVTFEQAARLVEMTSDVSMAQGPEASAAAVEALRDELVRVYGNLDAANEATDGLVDLLNEAVIATADIASTDMAGGVKAAADEAARLAQNLFAARQQQLADRGMVYSGRGGDPRTSNQQGYGEFGRPNTDQIIAEEKAKLEAALNKGSRGGRRGGGGGGRDPQADALRDAARLYDQTRTAAERYSTEQAQVNALLTQGHIDAETAARAMAMLDQKYRDAAGGMGEFAGFQKDLKNSLLDAAMTGEAAFGRIGDAIKRAALQMLLFGEGPFAGLLGSGSMFKGILGGLFGGKLLSFDGGGWTGEGARSGGLDGKGGFLAMLHPRERVVDETRAGRAGGAGPVRVVVETVASPYFDTRVAQIAQAGDQASMRMQQRAMPGMLRNMQARGLK